MFFKTLLVKLKNDKNLFGRSTKLDLQRYLLSTSSFIQEREESADNCLKLFEIAGEKVILSGTLITLLELALSYQVVV